MSFDLKFLKNQDIVNQNQIIDLLDGAFGNTCYSNNTETSFFTGYESKYPNFILLYKEKVLVGVAIIAKRMIKVLNQKINAITVGPLAIGAPYQRKGYSRPLFLGIEKLAKNLNAELIYLQGLDGFYSKYEYFPYLAKSKIELKIKDLTTKDQVIIKPYAINHLKEIMDLYNSISENNNFTSYRTKEDWTWLTKYATKSYYFYQPYVVIQKNKVIGYFCSDPDDKNRLREVIYSLDQDNISSFLYGIKLYGKQNNLSIVELMTPPESLLVKYIKNYSSGTFKQFIMQDGGQLLKICNYKSVLKIIKSNMLYEREESTLDININNDDIKIMLTDKNTKKQLMTFKCKKRHFSGFISGYLGSEVLFDYHSSTQKDIRIFNNNLSALTPFVYQGDNF